MRKWRVLALVSAVVLALIGGSSAAWAVDPSPSPSSSSSPSGSISGTVTTDTGASAEGMQVIAHVYNPQWTTWFWQEATTVAADGSYTLANLPDGDYRIEFQSGSAATSIVNQFWQGAADIWSATTVTISGGAAVSGISPVMTVGASISGTVTDESGAPVAGASVRATDPSGSWVAWANTDMSGAYRLTGLGAGSYLVQFSPLGGGTLAGQWWKDASFQSDATQITVATGQDASGTDAVLHAAGSITGVLTDDTGAAAPNVFISVFRATANGAGEWVGSSMTDANGAYTVGALPAGSYKMQFSSTGPLLSQWYDNAADAASGTTVLVTAGAATRADGVLTVGATVRGVVTDASGQPVPGVVVWAHPTSGGGYTSGTSTAADGSYSITGLVPGDYKVEFETDQVTPNFAPVWWQNATAAASATVLPLAAGQVLSGISPRLAAGGGITGVVRDGSGAPLLEAQVGVFDSTGAWIQNAWTGPDGSYTVRGLAPGKYRLQYRQQLSPTSSLSEWWRNAPDLARSQAIVVGAGKVVTGVDVILSQSDHSVLETNTASLSGVVKDALGHPLAGVEVGVESNGGGDGTMTDANGAWSMTGLAAGTYHVSFTGEVGGSLVTQWWNGQSSSGAATPITLVNAQQRTGIDAILGADALPPLASATPKITGQPRVGTVVIAHSPGWTAGTHLAYEWFADGTSIPNATGETLAVTPDLVGKKLSVAVTGSLAGYQSIVQTSAQTAPVQAQ